MRTGMMYFRTLCLASLITCCVSVGSGHAYLIRDYGFTQLTNGNLRANVHSILNYDSAYAPGMYDYVYQVTNNGAAAITWFGVFGGALALLNTEVCQVAPVGAVPPPPPSIAPACVPGGTLPVWVSNFGRPDLTWQILVVTDGLANPANYAVAWGKTGGLAVNATLTFQVASPNPPIQDNAFIDPIATSSGFYVRDATGLTAEANYIPEPSTLVLLMVGLAGLFATRRRNAIVGT